VKQSFDLTGLSARTRRLLVLGIRGGDGDTPLPTDVLFERVEGMADLLDEDLVQLDADLAAALDETLENPTDESLELGERIAAAIDSVRGAYLTRAAEAEERDARAEALRARVHGDADLSADAGAGDEDEDGDAGDGDAGGDDSGDDADTGADGAADDAAGDAGTDDGAAAGQAATQAGTGDRLAAAAGTTITRVAARRPQATRPRAPQRDVRTTLRASANVPGTEFGADLSTPEAFADALGQVVNATAGYRGPRVFHKIATLGAMDAADIYGEERTLRRDAQENERRIAALTNFHDRDMLTASGGICAPPQVNYTLPTMGTDAEPFWDSALARMGADRGGVRTFPPTMMSEVTGAVSAWTEANDIALNAPATKPCLVMTCPDETQTLVDAIVRCMKIGNFRARFFPEQIAEWQTKIAQYAARFAETRAITQVGAGSTQVSAGTVLGTTRDVLAVIDRAAAGIRSRHRLPQDFPLRVAFPDWLRDNMRVDLSRELPGATAERLATSEAMIEEWFTVRNVNVTWFLDGESGQIFGAQGDGALLGWPSHVIGYMYPEGAWLGLDGGTLDLGIVRDSTLNSTNDFMIFAEVFRNTHFHGYESLRLDIDICPNGATAAASAITPCTLGS
jgi:hypothetical protein